MYKKPTEDLLFNTILVSVPVLIGALFVWSYFVTQRYFYNYVLIFVLIFVIIVSTTYLVISMKVKDKWSTKMGHVMLVLIALSVVGFFTSAAILKHKHFEISGYEKDYSDGVGMPPINELKKINGK